MIATGLILLLSVTAIPILEISSQREKEENLRITLNELRGALDLYNQDHGAYPASIGTLLTTRPHLATYGFYLRRFPLNPLVASTQWEIASRTVIGGAGEVWVPCAAPGTRLPGSPPIVDIRSPHFGEAINGTSYADW